MAPSVKYNSAHLVVQLAAAIIVVATAVAAAEAAPLMKLTKKENVLSFYLQQEIGLNELVMVPAARAPVNGTATGFGLEMVYEFVMTETADPASAVMGYVRGTAIAVNNTAAATVFFINNVVHIDYKGVTGTLSQQGEAVFTASSWEFSVVGGTGAFRNAFGYSVGTPVSGTRTPSGRLHVVTHYDARFCLARSC